MSQHQEDHLQQQQRASRCYFQRTFATSLRFLSDGKEIWDLGVDGITELGLSCLILLMEKPTMLQRLHLSRGTSHQVTTSNQLQEPLSSYQQDEDSKALISPDAKECLLDTVSNISTAKDPDCIICGEELSALCLFKPCHHHFDYDCILRWLNCNPDLVELKCPLCRQEVVEVWRDFDTSGNFNCESSKELLEGIGVRLRDTRRKRIERWAFGGPLW